MNNILEHHGILGMKWGIRRTPEQLGHKPENKTSPHDNKLSKSDSESTDKFPKKAAELSDEELTQRIKRLNMEEEYDRLLARRKDRDISALKKFMSDAMLNLSKKGIDKAIDAFVNRLFTKDTEDAFDINDYKNMNLEDIPRSAWNDVVKWYEHANEITKTRGKLGHQVPPS